MWQTWTTLMLLPGVSCARLANAPAPASRSRKQGGLVTRTSTSVSRAVGSLVACDSACHVLTCHSNADSLVLAANNIVLSIASISRRSSDGPRFHIWHTGSSEFLFRASGRHPNVWILSVEALFLSGIGNSDRWVDSDAVTRVSNASYHLAIVASGALLDSELSEKSSSMGQVRFFPTAFGRTSNHHSF